MSWSYKIVDPIGKSWPEPLIAEWRSISENNPENHVFFHPSLVNCWFNIYKRIWEIKPFVIHAVNDSNTALFPLVVWQRNWKNAGIRDIIPIGYCDFDYHNPLFKITPTPEELDSYWQGLIPKLKSTFKTDRIILNGITDRFLSRNTIWDKNEICPLLDISGIRNENNLLNSLNTSLRGDIRRQMRRLNEIGELKFSQLKTLEEISEDSFNEFLYWHEQRWPNAFKAQGFHWNLLKTGLCDGLVHFSKLTVGSTDIAWHLGFYHNRRFYYYMPAYNHNYRKFSPAKIHLFFLISWAMDNDCIIFDHLRGEENYKSGWSSKAINVNSHISINTSVTTNVKCALLKLKNSLITK